MDIMAISHQFNNESKYTDGGNWYDDYGKIICRWEWDADSKTLSINCGVFGSKIDLGIFGNHQFTDEKLKQKLPTLAIEKAEQILNTKYEI